MSIDTINLWATLELHAMRNEIVSRMDALKSNMAIDHHIAGADESDRASAINDMEQNTNTHQALTQRLSAVNRAIARLESGDYGICLASGEEIPLDRLRANPLAEYTIHEQARREKLAAMRA